MIQVFGGHGFVGGNYVKNYPNCIVNEKHDYTVSAEATDIVYLISTISNYNVKTDSYLDINTNLITLMRVLEQCKDNDARDDTCSFDLFVDFTGT